MAFASGRPPGDRLPFTSTRPTRPRGSSKSQGEWITKILENHTKTSAHDVDKYMEELALKKKLREEAGKTLNSLKRSYHGNPAIIRDNQYKTARNEQHKNDENIVKAGVPPQRTMVDEDENQEKEQKTKVSESKIQSQRTMVNKKENSRDYESEYKDLGKVTRLDRNEKESPITKKQTMVKDGKTDAQVPLTSNTILRPSRRRYPKKFMASSQNTLPNFKEEENSDESSDALDESNGKTTEKIVENEENSGNLSNRPGTLEKLQNNDKRDNFFEYIYTKKWYEKQINEGGEMLLEIERKRKERETKLILKVKNEKKRGMVHRGELSKNTNLGSLQILQILKKVKYPSIPRQEVLDTIKEGNEGSEIHPKPHYRGSGVKFNATVFLQLDLKDDRLSRLQKIIHEDKKISNKRFFKIEEEIDQREGKKGETLKIETRNKRKKIAARTNEVEYLIECPPPQDRPPDSEQKIELVMTPEVEYPIPCPSPQDRPPDYQQNENKITDKEKTSEDWGRETVLRFLRYIDRPPFEPPNQYRLRNNKRTETLFLLRHVQRPPFLEGPSHYR